MIDQKLIPAGYKQTEVGVIPEDWGVNKIINVTPSGMKNGIVDGPFGSNLKTIHYKKSGIPIITSGFVTDGYFYAAEYLYVTEEKFRQEKRSAVYGGDIVMAKIGARCGASAILPKHHTKSILSGNALKITVDESKNNTYFIWQILWGLYTRHDLEGITTVGAQPAISMANLKEYLIPLPPLKEQTAIANALSDVDALIAALEKLINKKSAIKTAAMQQLLTGKKRLPPFDQLNTGNKQTELGEIPGDWECCHLESVFSIKSGFSFKGEFFSENGPIVLTPGNFKLDGGLYFEERNTKRYCSSYPNTAEFKNGDLLIVMTDLTPECNLLGKPAFVEHDELLLHNQRIGKLENINRNWNKRFLYYTLLSPVYLADIKETATGSTVRHTSNKSIYSALVFQPGKEEQTAIANVLSDMDKDLEALQQRLHKTQEIKQGMMQELLTGKTRLMK